MEEDIYFFSVISFELLVFIIVFDMYILTPLNPAQESSEAVLRFVRSISMKGDFIL